MITLEKIYSDLTYGEFTHLNIGAFMQEEHESEPDPKNWAQLISWISLGLTSLYTEFLLQGREIYIQQDEAISEYFLEYRFAVTEPSVPGETTRYIVDSVASPFLDDVLRIEEVYDELGNKLFLNDHNEDLSIFTPSYKSIQVPWPNDFNSLAVQYRANHREIIYTSGMDPATTEIHLPESHREALLFFVASRAFGSLNTDQGTEGNDYYRKYLAKISDIYRQGMYIQPEPANSRFEANGFA